MKTMQKEQATPAKQKSLTKKERLLSNPDIKRWYLNIKRSSLEGADISLYNLGKFCEVHNMTPIELRELANRDLKTVTNLLQDHITAMEEKINAPKYIHSHIAAVKSWLADDNIKISIKLRITNLNSTPTLRQERTPNGSEMSEIQNRASLRAGAAISLIAKSGLRPQVLGNYNASDGLIMKDLPDIAVIQGVVVCVKSPPRIIVRESLSKTRHPYFTLLTLQGTKRVTAYLNDRLVKGDTLNADSPVIAADIDYRYRKSIKTRFIRTAQISRLIRETLRPRFNLRAYVLRAYFDTQLLIAESKGKVAHDFRVFWMGHSGSIEATYTVNKGVLPEQLMNEMRESFKRCEEFLDLELREEDPLLKQKEELKAVIDRATPEQVQEMRNAWSIGVCNTSSRE